MKVVIHEKSAIEREVEVSVESTRVQQSYDKHLRDVMLNVAIPGFRKGKAPRGIVERYANKEQLLRTVFEEIGPPAFQQAVRDQQLAPLGEPHLELVQFEPGKDLVFKATIEICPNVEIADADYNDLEVEIPRSVVTDDDVERVVDDLRKNAMHTIAVDEDRGLQQGDVAIVDYEAREGERRLPKGTGDNVPMELNDGPFFPGFADNLLGMKVDESRTFTVTFPADYRDKDLAARDITFNIHLKTIKKYEMPEADDDFAEEVSRFQTIAALKADIREKLERNLQLEVGNRAIYKIAERKTDLPVPRAYTNNVIMHTLENQARRLSVVGIKFEDYLRSKKIDIQRTIEQMRPGAEISARAEMVVEAIAKKEGVQITDDDLHDELRRYAEANQRDFDEVKADMEKNDHVESFRADIQRQRVLLLVAGKATVLEKAETVQEGTPAS